MKNKKKIFVLSHACIKKINLSFFDSLSKNKKYKIINIIPKYIYSGEKKIYPDFRKAPKNIIIIKKKLIFKSIRFFFFEKIHKEINKYKPDYILVDNDVTSLQSLIIIFYSFFYRFKICYFCYENDVKNLFRIFTLKKLIKFIFINILCRLIAFKVFKIFCITNQIKDNYNSFGFEKKTVLMPLGYNENIFKKKSKNKSSFFNIGYFGRINKKKGVHVLLKALKNIKIKNWRLYLDIDIIEDKSYYDYLINFFNKNFSPKKLIKVKSDHFNIAKIMSKMHLVVIPSIYNEQYGRVIQESVASGSLVIGSKIGGIPEIIKDDDLMFEPNNHNMLAKKINKLNSKKYYTSKRNSIFKTIIKERTISEQIKVFTKEI